MTEIAPENDIQKSAPPKTALMPADDPGNRDYMLRTPQEVAAILRALIEHGTLMTVHFNQGRDFFISSVLALSVDGKSMVIDLSSSEEMNRDVLDSDKQICVSNLDKIKIQFVLRGLRPIQYEGHGAFLTAVPETLLRLQRREFYRLSMPPTHPLRCVLPIKPTGKPSIDYAADILDISGGGIGIIAPSEEIPLSTDMLIQNCRIELPDTGDISVDLRIRNLFEMTGRTGTRNLRAGCQFINLSGQTLMTIQRFIIRAERERKARESGLAYHRT